MGVDSGVSTLLPAVFVPDLPSFLGRYGKARVLIIVGRAVRQVFAIRGLPATLAG